MFDGDIRRKTIELERHLDRCLSDARRDADTIEQQARTIHALTSELTMANLKARFHKKTSGVYRRRWEAAARPGSPAQSEADKVRRDGEARIAQAINARTPAGDPDTAKHLRGYADRRLAEMQADGKGDIDYDSIAEEILEGEDDDE